MALQHTLKARWAAMAPREQRGLTLAVAVVALALVWSVLLAPALRTLKGVAAQNLQLATELERMQALQARAKLLQAKPALAPKESLKALQSAAAALGKAAVLQTMGDQATLTLKQVSAADLAPWLSPGSGTGLSASEVRLQRSGDGAEPLWSGTLVFVLPAGATAAP
jgi:general secretion pathway protein M